MQERTKNIGIILLIANVLVLAGIGYYAFKVKDKRTSFIVNQRVFNEFLGKKEMERKLNALRAKNNRSVDSLSFLIHRSNDATAISAYQEGIDNIKLTEQQLSEQYTAEIWKQINQWVSEFGKQQGYDFVLGAAGNGSLMYANEANDVTNEMILFVNKKYQGD
jgi:outer membrane protein